MAILWPVALDRAARARERVGNCKRWAYIKMERFVTRKSNQDTHTHTSSCKSPFESASVGVCAFVCSRPPLALHWQLQPQLGEFVSEFKSSS